MLPDVPILEIPALLERSELVILAIPEAEIETLVAGLAATGSWQPGQLVLHTAPGLGYGVLAPAAAAGVIPLAVHPTMVFTGTSLDLVRMRESFFAVTAPTPVLPIGQALVVEMGGEPIIIAEADRAAYAEAVSTATNVLGIHRAPVHRHARRPRHRIGGAGAGTAAAVVGRDRATEAGGDADLLRGMPD